MAIRTTKALYCDQCNKEAGRPDPDDIYDDDFLISEALTMGEWYELRGPYATWYLCSNRCVRSFCKNVDTHSKAAYDAAMED